jgi:hypothetical protein
VREILNIVRDMYCTVQTGYLHTEGFKSGELICLKVHLYTYTDSKSGSMVPLSSKLAYMGETWYREKSSNSDI